MKSFSISVACFANEIRAPELVFSFSTVFFYLVVFCIVFLHRDNFCICLIAIVFCKWMCETSIQAKPEDNTKMKKSRSKRKALN